MIGNLPEKYSAADKDSIINEVNASISTLYRGIAILQPKVQEQLKVSQAERARLAELTDSERSKITILNSNAALLDCGFGVGLLIVSGGKKEDQVVDELDKNMAKLIGLEESIRARALGIPKKDPKSGLTDPRCEIPNWSKTIGAQLPSWGDPAQRKNLVSLIVSQVKSNTQSISQFKKSIAANAPVTRGACAELASTLLHTNFLFGVFSALAYARQADFKDMESYEVKGTKYTTLAFMKLIEGLFEKNRVDDVIATAISKVK
jgi:hypothetical protein